MLDPTSVELLSLIANIAGVVMFVDWLRCARGSASSKAKLESILKDIKGLVTELPAREGDIQAIRKEVSELREANESLKKILAESKLMPDQNMTDRAMRGSKWFENANLATIVELCVGEIDRARKLLQGPSNS